MDPYNQPSPRRLPPQSNGIATPPMRPGGAAPPPGAPEPLRPNGASNGMTRAEKFEDEKLRIMSSCFSKRDEKGQLLQSYITHIRVEEDAAYPSDPPPLAADPQHKKARAIMVAVKNTGRVYMHKARENPDGTFQIGKSWPLEDLAQIETFSPEAERPPDDAVRAQLGGPAGLVITMNKPYFWKAMTPKEKDFFIASLCKIYRKYTSGQVPKLKGFSPREESDILGASQQASGMHPRAAPPTPGLPPPGAVPGGPPPALRADGGRASPGQSPARRPNRPSDMSDSMRSVSNDSSGQRPPSPLRHRNIPPNDFNRTQSPSQQPGPDMAPRLRSQPSQDSTSLRTAPSRDNVNGTRLQQLQQPPPHRLSPQSSHSNFSRTSPAPPLDNGLRSPKFPPGPTTGSPEPLGRGPKGLTSDAVSGAVAATERMRSPGLPPSSPPGAYHDPMTSNGYSSGPSGGFEAGAANGSRQILPERRRPPLEDSSHAARSSNEDNAPRPLKSKLSQSGIPRSIPDQSATDLPRMPGAFSTGSTPSATPPPTLDSTAREPPKRLPEPTTSSTSQAAPPPALSSTSRPTTPQAKPRTESPAPIDTSSSPSKGQDARPGLGPMVNETVASPTQRSKNWNRALNTAATAAKLAAFKPRAGGAAGRLFQAEKKDTGEPDGISGVVPAPAVGPPRKESTSLQTDRSQGTHSASNSQSKSATADTRGRDRSSSGVPGLDLVAETEAEGPAKAPLASKFNESVAALGVDGTLLGARGQEYEATLANLGWTNNILQIKTVEALETSLRKEVGRLEAGSWLGYSEGTDERVEQFEKVLDRAIAECDEMEGLLTLYGVELGTLNEDIAYIEAQSGGIQVQTANQKLLQRELQELIKTQEPVQ